MIVWIKTFVYKLGSIQFAILLITTTVIFVIAGTLLESYAESHRFAALWTYQNPVFILLLWGFFINILVSALLRWPFKLRHIPFLITHLGLLMILGGVLIKSYFGVQGSMLLVEGTGSQHLLINEKPALLVETKKRASSIPLPNPLTHSFNIGELEARIVRYTPHAIERYLTWSKGPHVFISGLRPFPIQHWEEGSPLPLSGKVRFLGPESDPWSIRAMHVKDINHKFEPDLNNLLILVDDRGNHSLCCKDSGGNIVTQSFKSSVLEKYIAYDRGFGGYSVPTTLPIGPKGIAIEAPLTHEFKEIALPLKPEDYRPVITLELKEGEQKDVVTLGYDRYANGIKWPALSGKYLIRFQPYLEEIPYRIRLHRGRQINYANSNQPFSYECDITVTDLRSGEQVETTLRMNRVHETWDGYRFYMSSISPGDNSAVHKVQIVVNHDPAKYWLTYPGAIILALGISLLFWFWPYKKHE